MTRGHLDYDVDLFDDPLDDDFDELDGFHRVVDISHDDVYGDVPECDFGFGDSDGFCIKSKYGCHIVGCPYATEIN